MATFTESIVEQAAITWLKGLGYGDAFAGVVGTLANLRDSRLPKLMRGVVRLKDVEKLL